MNKKRSRCWYDSKSGAFVPGHSYQHCDMQSYFRMFWSCNWIRTTVVWRIITGSDRNVWMVWKYLILVFIIFFLYICKRLVDTALIYNFSKYPIGRIPVQEVPFFYTLSHLSELWSCKSIISTHFPFIFIYI